MFFANRHIQIFKFKNLIYIECWEKMIYSYLHVYTYLGDQMAFNRGNSEAWLVMRVKW